MILWCILLLTFRFLILEPAPQKSLSFQARSPGKQTPRGVWCTVVNPRWLAVRPYGSLRKLLAHIGIISDNQAGSTMPSLGPAGHWLARAVHNIVVYGCRLTSPSVSLARAVGSPSMRGCCKGSKESKTENYRPRSFVSFSESSRGGEKGFLFYTQQKNCPSLREKTGSHPSLLRQDSWLPFDIEINNRREKSAYFYIRLIALWKKRKRASNTHNIVYKFMTIFVLLCSCEKKKDKTQNTKEVVPMIVKQQTFGFRWIGVMEATLPSLQNAAKLTVSAAGGWC